MTACSTSAEKEIKELGSGYGLDVDTVSETKAENERLTVLNLRSAERLFQYISHSLEEENYNDAYSIEKHDKLDEPVEDVQKSGSHRASNAVYTEQGEMFAEFSRNIRVDYEAEITEPHPDYLHLKNMEAAASGMPGFEWSENNTACGFIEDTGEIIIYTDGKWKIHFVYEEEEVYFEVEDNWYVAFTPEQMMN
jgi:hypothetical protein